MSQSAFWSSWPCGPWRIGFRATNYKLQGTAFRWRLNSSGSLAIFAANTVLPQAPNPLLVGEFLSYCEQTRARGSDEGRRVRCRRDLSGEGGDYEIDARPRFGRVRRRIFLQ